MIFMKGRDTMPKSSGQKLKLYHLAKIFAEETDFNSSTGEFHGFTLNELIEKLEKLGIGVERKTVYSDFADLRSMGMDISRTKRGRSTIYYCSSLPYDFEMSELKILVDSVQAAKFISERQSNAIIGKIEKLCSKNRRAELQHSVSMNGRVKTMNSSVIYAVDTINQAINSDKQISFDYYKWTLKETELQKKNKDYIVNPIALVWENENYYLIAYNSSEEVPLRHYRVDKMKNATVLAAPRDCGDFAEQFDVNKYVQSIFGMFGGSEERVVIIEADESLVGIFKDRFKELSITSNEGGKFRAQITVRPSMQFFGWLFGISPAVKILSPDDIKDEYINCLKKSIEMYS